MYDLCVNSWGNIYHHKITLAYDNDQCMFIMFQSMFEIITSEASYLKSLNVLIDVFLMSPEFSSEMSDRCVITRNERHVLFSNVGAIREASEKSVFIILEQCVVKRFLFVLTLFSHSWNKKDKRKRIKKRKESEEGRKENEVVKIEIRVCETLCPKRQQNPEKLFLA